MIDNHRLSVIVSLYNAEKFIRGFMDNVMEQQSLEDMQILLLDAQSSDNTASIIGEYNHASLEYVLLKDRLSIYETWNKGIALSKAPIVSNWNADDRRKFNSLHTQLCFMEANPEIDVCYGHVAWSHKANEKFEDANTYDLYPCFDVTPHTMMVNNSPHCMPVWRKSLHERFGLFDLEYPTAADFDFWMRCLEGGAKFQKLYETVGLYYYNPQGLSTNSQSSNMNEGSKIKEKFKHLL